MAVLRVVLLVVAVLGVLSSRARLPLSTVPLALVAVGLVSGVLPVGLLPSALEPLAGALGFLLVAVPLSVLLDRLGFFLALSRVVGSHRHAGAWLWALAAGVVAVLNLDAAVVLLTPLYVALARRWSLDVRALAFQPLLLSCLASSFLPVSNLTNLIALSGRPVSPLGFLAHLGLPSLAAVLVGYALWRRVLPLGPVGAPPREAVDKRVLVIGGAVVAAVLVGFLIGPLAGIAPWEVALAADVVLVCVVRSLPWRAVPLDLAAVAAALGVLAAAAARHVGLAPLFTGAGPVALVRASGAAAGLAALANNLPAVLVLRPLLPPGASDALWAVLLGVNIAPLVLVTGSLAGLLWSDVLRRLGAEVGPRQFSRVGVLVGLPALAAAVVVLVATTVLR